MQSRSPRQRTPVAADDDDTTLPDRLLRKYAPAQLEQLEPSKTRYMTYQEYLNNFIFKLPQTEDDLKGLFRKWDRWQREVCTQRRYRYPAFVGGFMITFITILGLLALSAAGGVTLFNVAGVAAETLLKLVTGQSLTDVDEEMEQKANRSLSSLTDVKGIARDTLNQLLHSWTASTLTQATTASAPLSVSSGFLGAHGAYLLKETFWATSAFGAVLAGLYASKRRFRAWVFQAFIGGYALVIDRTCRAWERSILELSGDQMRKMLKNPHVRRVLMLSSPQRIREEWGEKALRSGTKPVLLNTVFSVKPARHTVRTGQSLIGYRDDHT